MHDDHELRAILRRIDRPIEPDPAFADALFAQLTAPPAARPARGPMLLIAAALLVSLLLAGAAIGSGLVELPWLTADATPTAQPSRSAQATESAVPSETPAASPSEAGTLAYEPPPGVLPPGAIVVVLRDLELRELPRADAPVVATVTAGEERVVGGPWIIGGERWWGLSPTSSTARGGYVVLDPTADVELAPISCPSEEPTLAVVAPLSGWERLACYGDREMTLEGHEVVGFGGFRLGTYEPAWLNSGFGAFALAPTDPTESSYLFVAVEPGSVDITRPQPSADVGTALLRVTGHFNDEAATSCTATDIPFGGEGDAVTAHLEPIATEITCRQEFVVTAFEVVDEGSGEAPSLAQLEVGSVVAPVLEGVTLREQPGTSGARIGILASGSRNVVVEGPVEADGFLWYRLAASGLPPASGCIGPLVTDPLSCPIWYGWAAAGNPDDGSAWFVRIEFDCPDPATETTAFLLLEHRLPLACYGSDELTFTAWFPELPEGYEPPSGTCAADPSIAWLHCLNLSDTEVWETREYTGAAEMLFIDPRSGLTIPERGQWLRIAGSYDHPASAACAGANQQEVIFESDDLAALECRLRFVVSAVEVTSAP